MALHSGKQITLRWWVERERWGFPYGYEGVVACLWNSTSNSAWLTCIKEGRGKKSDLGTINLIQFWIFQGKFENMNHIQTAQILPDVPLCSQW